MARVVVNTKAIEELGRDIKRAKRMLLGRLAERGYQLLREEVPIKTGNLKQGVAPPSVDYENLRAEITVSARSGRRGISTGTVHYPSGKTKTVTLRPSPAFNYAEAVAKGRPSIRPRVAQVLIIPVSTSPTGESYLMSGGQVYVFRKRATATKPNPFDVRAAERLDKEQTGIADAVLRNFFQ